MIDKKGVAPFVVVVILLVIAVFGVWYYDSSSDEVGGEGELAAIKVEPLPGAGSVWYQDDDTGNEPHVPSCVYQYNTPLGCVENKKYYRADNCADDGDHVEYYVDGLDDACGKDIKEDKGPCSEKCKILYGDETIDGRCEESPDFCVAGFDIRDQPVFEDSGFCECFYPDGDDEEVSVNEVIDDDLVV